MLIPDSSAQRTADPLPPGYPSWYLIEDEGVLWNRLENDAITVKDDSELPFSLLDLVGEGAFGRVHLGVHKDSGRRLALKVLDRSVLFKGGGDKIIGAIPRNESVELNALARCPSSNELTSSASGERAVRRLRRLVNEIEVLQYLSSCPNISHLFGCWVSPRRIYVALQFIEGSLDLFEYIVKSYPLSNVNMKVLFRSLCETVNNFHIAGVVHRDLKLENILLTRDKTPVIIDFGMSARFIDGMKLYSACGTPFYASPEVITANESGTGYFPHPVDVWSLGKV
jgi:serine/threonine protein kinase